MVRYATGAVALLLLAGCSGGSTSSPPSPSPPAAPSAASENPPSETSDPAAEAVESVCDELDDEEDDGRSPTEILQDAAAEGDLVVADLRAAVNDECPGRLEDLVTRQSAAREASRPLPSLPPPPSPTPLPENIRRDIFAGVIEENRTAFIDGIAAAHPVDVRSVDLLDFDPATGVLSLAVTSLYSTDDQRTSLAWRLSSALARVFYNVEGDGAYYPQWSLTVDQLTFLCPPETMRAVEDSRQTREQWEAACV